MIPKTGDVIMLRTYISGMGKQEVGPMLVLTESERYRGGFYNCYLIEEGKHMVFKLSADSDYDIVQKAQSSRP